MKVPKSSAWISQKESLENYIRLIFLKDSFKKYECKYEDKIYLISFYTAKGLEDPKIYVRVQHPNINKMSSIFSTDGEHSWIAFKIPNDVKVYIDKLIKLMVFM